GWAVPVAALGLFAVWSNSFIAIGYLLGAEGAAARFDWLSLTVGRFLPVAPVCGAYCLLFRRQESLRLVRMYPIRLSACGFLVVWIYSFALYWGQQHGVPAPIASLETALVPLFLMLLGVLVLGERLTRGRLLGFTVALTGIVIIARAKEMDGAGSYGLLIAVTALAPLSWSVFSILSKPVTHGHSSLVWTYLVIAVGGLPLAGIAPFAGWREIVSLDLPGALALGYLSFLCTVLGFAVWTWLLGRLPASVLGFAVFLNPPLTTLFKVLFSLLLPGIFAFTIVAGEWIGGTLALVGMLIAVSGVFDHRSASG
ncbi:MAG: DMT family transporter, partial [Thermoanaerobaculia bacterium]|nr:DMT family transporter [Thermoanaerobaculia bacterium]